MRAGYGAGTIPFPDNRYAFSYPVKQNYQGSAANGFQRAGSMAVGFPAPALLDIPSNGIIPVAGTSLQNATLDVIPNNAARRHAALVERAFQRQRPSLTADIAYVGNRGVDLVMDVDSNAGMVYGAGNAGRQHCAVQCRRNRTRTNEGKSDTTGSRSRSIAGSGTGSSSPTRTPEPVEGLRERERRHRHADRLESELGPIELRSPAQLRRDGALRAAMGTRQAVAERGVLASIIGGWQVSGIYTLQSGTPLTITGNGTVLNTPATPRSPT